MAFPRRYPDAKERSRQEARRRRARERADKAAWLATFAKPAPKLTPSEAVTLYRIEKARAEQRWQENGGPTCGFTSGRHPIVWSMGTGALR